ncbi:MAG: TIGR01459 family HAD-type hydrolase [Paracoccaceae bacterium]|nr:TIGR01459 family HAD-type hydrolase [Paracoccaceae bacterium]MDH5528396.1 TIGR01459 family HAD-type hydrolase [Paracoccaceae bacterium]
MTQLIQSFNEISSRYDIVLCDLWGCLHNGKAPFPAAVSALQRFRNSGGFVVLLTNAPRPSSFVIEQLARLGVPTDTYDIVVSSGDAAQIALFSGAVGRRIYHLGPEKDAGFFEQIPAEFAQAKPIFRVPLAEAEGIVCTGPFDDQVETPEDYRATFLSAKARGLKLLCANPDISVDLGDKRIYCGGALAALYEEMGGESLYFGKPHPPIYDLARSRIAALTGKDRGPDKILAIGDGIKTDILGGIGEGIDTLFVTGGLEAANFGPDPEAPVAALLEDWLRKTALSPTYSIGKFR